jgi:beta-lactamase regulating signal transducer with metallopeptidase domain
MDAFIFYTLKSSICLSAGYLLFYLLLRRETFHRIKRFILLGIILFSLLIPLIKLPVKPSVISSPLQKLESTMIPETPSVVVTRSAEKQQPLRQQESTTISLLTVLYLAGASVQIILILVALARILSILVRSRKIRYRDTRLALISAEIVPFCFGRHIVISQKDFENNADAVILHEKTHLAKNHNLDLLISQGYLIITWYNPFSWLIRHELKQNHEFEADRTVLGHGVDEADYQLLLVRTVAGESLFNLANQFNQPSIKTRISMMNKTKSNPRAILKALLFLPLIALMIQAFAQKEIKTTVAPLNGTAAKKYLVLPTDQLKLLGFEFNNTGLYFKNKRPGTPEHNVLCLYFTDHTYSASISLKPGEKLKGKSAPEKFLMNAQLTNYDFAPLIVSSYGDHRTIVLGGMNQFDDEKLLPIQVNMAELNINKRSDTLVFWFRPTDALKQILSPIARVEEYIQPCPPDPGQKAK